MNKRLFALISIIIIVLLLGTSVYSFNKVIKGYDLNKVKSDISVKGDLIEGNEYSFHTFIKLGKEEPLSSSIIELNIRTQIEMDKSTNKYILKNPKFQVNPIGCEQYEKHEFITENGYSGNYQFGVERNHPFKQTMDVGVAKILLDSRNVKINNISSTNTDIKINSISSLKKSTKNNSKVVVEFTTLDQYYTMWYSIKFAPISNNEGIFRVD